MKQSYSKEQKQYHVATWHQSGLTKTAYCAQTGIAFSTFKSWCSRPMSQLVVPFIPIVVNNADEVNMLIHFPNGVRMDIPATQLMQVLKALTPC